MNATSCMNTPGTNPVPPARPVRLPDAAAVPAGWARRAPRSPAGSPSWGRDGSASTWPAGWTAPVPASPAPAPRRFVHRPSMAAGHRDGRSPALLLP
ncbi:hypothetical protein [Kitasatospora sp. NPDC057015]|uniref:hypothetical protein n=1 Tax=Kitasatospora sp. NPDC057015 TaxID=3346001 RepID=UPI00363CFA0B